MSQKKKKKKKLIWSILKIFIITIITIGMLGGVAFAGVMLAMVKTSPDLDLSGILTLNEPSVLYDDKGNFMDEAPTLEKRETIALKDMPEDLKNAFVSVEDERFQSHHGVDFKRLAGVVYADVKKIITGKGNIQGASTITQQLVRNTVLTNEVTIKRKVQEMYLSMELEKALSKDQILEAYLNTINLGGNIHGVQKASKHYFNRDLKDLTLIECAYIAGITQNPSRYYAFSPARQKDPSPYIERTKIVLGQMLRNNNIDNATYDKAIADLDSGKLQAAFVTPKSIEQASKLNYEWFSRPVMDAVKEDLKKQYKYSNEEVEKLLMYGGLKIYTTMNRELQDASQKILDDDKNLGIKSVSSGTNGAIQPQGAAVVVDYRTGQVKVIIGGRGEQPARSYNRAASNNFLKPVGSAIKPITVYAPAIDTKFATAATVIEDSPLPEEIGKQWPVNGKPYNPSNYDTSGFRGYLTLREALKRSINLVAIKIEYEIGLKTGLSYAEKFGIKFNKTDSTSISALSLGQFEGATPLAMATAFGTFGNNGMYTDSVLYTKVVDKSGKVLLETKPVVRKVLSPQSSYLMYDLLQGPTSWEEGATASNARIGQMPVAGKTGTSSEKKDFWFAGLTPYYSGAVWLGNDTPKTYNNIYSSTSAGIWSKIMTEAHKNLPVKDIDMPSGLTKALVCKDSGKTPTDLCARDPRGSRVYEEIFIEGTVPTTLCDVHVEAKVNKNNGKLINEFTPQSLIESRVFIKRNYSPREYLLDQKYVLPTEIDDAKKPEPEKEEKKEEKKDSNSLTDIIKDILNGNGTKTEEKTDKNKKNP
jgi:penicillin-binding protein 1A